MMMLILILASVLIVTNSFTLHPQQWSQKTSFTKLRQSEEDLFEAEEAAAFDAHDISDSGVEAAVMERAVMMAYDMMRKKKRELKEKVEDARAAEQQFVMMEQATNDLIQQYKENVSLLKRIVRYGIQISFLILPFVDATTAD